MLKFTVHTDIDEAMAVKLAEASTKAEETVATQVMKDTTPYVPASGSSSGLYHRTRVVGNEIIYPGPYARYLYYGKVMVDIETGEGPRHFVDEMGNEVILFRKGAKLRPTDRDLVFAKDHHPDAQAHWFEASKAENLNKWIKKAEEAVKRDL